MLTEKSFGLEEVVLEFDKFVNISVWVGRAILANNNVLINELEFKAGLVQEVLRFVYRKGVIGVS